MLLNIFENQKHNVIPKVFITIGLLTIFNHQLQSQIGLDNYVLEYQTISRAMSQRVVVKNKIYIYQKTRNRSSVDSLALKEGEAVKLNDLLKSLSLKRVPYLKAPSEERLSDGAAHAKLKISVKKKVYESTGFDHGNPPKEIKNLVEYILGISEFGKKTG